MIRAAISRDLDLGGLFIRGFDHSDSRITPRGVRTIEFCERFYHLSRQLIGQLNRIIEVPYVCPSGELDESNTNESLFDRSTSS